MLQTEVIIYLATCNSGSFIAYAANTHLELANRALLEYATHTHLESWRTGSFKEYMTQAHLESIYETQAHLESM